MTKPRQRQEPPQTDRAWDLRCTVISMIVEKLRRMDIQGLSAVLMVAETEMEAIKKGR